MVRRGFKYVPESERYSGREFEQDAFGAVPKSREYRRDFESVSEQNGYVPYRSAAELVRKHQPESEKDIAKEIRLAVAEELDLDDDDVRFFTSVGTPFDLYHGVDGFLEVSDPDSGKRYMVTLDATLNKEKQLSGHKADIFVGEIDVPRPSAPAGEVAHYLDEIEKVSKEIVSIYRSKRGRGESIDT